MLKLSDRVNEKDKKRSKIIDRIEYLMDLQGISILELSSITKEPFQDLRAIIFGRKVKGFTLSKLESILQILEKGRRTSKKLKLR